jgi:hypothetical protein
MTVIELLTLVFGALAIFWVFAYLGALVSKSTKIFDYGKLRKFFSRL